MADTKAAGAAAGGPAGPKRGPGGGGADAEDSEAEARAFRKVKKRKLAARWALLEIARRWNVLDYPEEGAFFVATGQPAYEDDRERRQMVGMFKGVLKKGSSTYHNPFGEDDTERLLSSFEQLNGSEKRAVIDLAQRCIKEQRAMDTEADIDDVLKPQPPLFVCPASGSDRADGTERCPFKTVDAAEEAVRKLLPDNERGECDEEEAPDAIRVLCKAPACDARPCKAPGCSRVVCSEHGMGTGYISPECDQLVFDDNLYKVGKGGGQGLPLLPGPHPVSMSVFYIYRHAEPGRPNSGVRPLSISGSPGDVPQQTAA